MKVRKPNDVSHFAGNAAAVERFTQAHHTAIQLAIFQLQRVPWLYQTIIYVW